MSGAPDEPRPGASEPGSDGRLDSWKEIAAYLRRSVRSARRWEKEEGLPVRRHVHGKGDSVYAYKTDLDGWWNDRGAKLSDQNGAEEALPPEPEVTNGGATAVEPGSAETVPPPSPRRSRKVAWIGAGFALAVLAVGVVAWLSRSGSGPSAGSLRPLPFQARDWVLVAGFENRSGQPLLDGTLEYALERELSNSRYVNVVPRERVGDALRLMRKPLDTRVDAAIGREICLRDGDIRALITGRIERLGSKYLLSVELADPNRSGSMTSAAEEAASEEQLLPAARRISDRVRAMLGEKVPLTQRGEASLLKVTTPSLRALKLYSQADTLIARDENAAAEELLKQAVTEDPDFASAHIHLAWAIHRQGRPKQQFLPEAETAFRLAETTTERERYFIRGSYYELLDQKDKAVAAYEALLSIYPDHFWATNNLTELYDALGRVNDAVRLVARRADLRPKDFEANFTAAWFGARSDPDPARARLYVRRTQDLVSPEVMESSSWEVAWLELFPAHDRWLEGDAAGALALGTRFAQKLKSTPLGRQDYVVEMLGRFFLTVGRLRTAEEFFHRLPNPTPCLANLSILRGNQRELRSLLKAAFVRSPNFELGMGVSLARAGLRDEAERVLAKGEKGSEAGLAEAVRGELAMARGRSAEAIVQLKKSQGSRDVFGSSPFFLGAETLASALARQGDLEGAVRALEAASGQRRRAVFRPLDNGGLWTRNQLLLARLYRKVGRMTDAQRIEAELSKLLALADADHPILRELKRLQAAPTQVSDVSARPIR